MTALASSLATLPETRRRLLDALKKSGELRAEDLATSTGITASGVRQHLQALEADGLVQHLERREGRGRPKHHFKLTAAADALYPRTYSELTNELLDYVSDDNPDLLERIFARRRERRLRAARVRLEPLTTLEARLRELTRILDEDGYLADLVIEENEYRIVEHNCAIFGVALKYGQACSSELEFIRAALPGTEVDRVKHMISGAHTCAYRVRRKGDSGLGIGESEQPTPS